MTLIAWGKRLFGLMTSVISLRTMNLKFTVILKQIISHQRVAPGFVSSNTRKLVVSLCVFLCLYNKQFTVIIMETALTHKDSKFL